MLTYDLSDPSHPTLVDSRGYDGSLVTARQVGSTVRLVLDGGLPALDFETPSSSVGQEEALAHNRAVVRASTVTDWLPQVTAYDTATHGPFGSPTSNALVDCSDVAVPETYNGLGTLTVVGLRPRHPGPGRRDSRRDLVRHGVHVADPPVRRDVAVATQAWQRTGGPIVMPMNAPGPTTDLRVRPGGHGRAVRRDGIGRRHGRRQLVDGRARRRAAGGRPSDSSGSVTTGTSIVLLRPESGRLMDVGQLDGLGVRQQLKSVRWFDDLAVLVTFQQIDPFYVVDLADPTRPRVLGALHLPGWSSYLHPVGPHLVLGLGQTSPQSVMVDPPQPLPTKPAQTVDPQPVDPQPMIPLQGAKATLFDISDPAHPRDLGTVAYPGGQCGPGGDQTRTR